MPETTEDEKLSVGELDLSSLLDANFGPAWSTGSASGKPQSSEIEEKKDGRRPRHRARKGKGGADGRPQLDSKQGKLPDRRRIQREGRSASRKHRQPIEEKPFHAVSFYPSVETFKALAANLRETSRTYELFDLAGTILAKPERCLIRVSLPPEAIEAGEILNISKVDGLIFSSAEEVIEHVIVKRPEQLFVIEEIEVEPPSGNFQSITRCGMTGVWLSPKNYHRYAEIIREHHAHKLPDTPFSRFESKLEIIKEDEAVATWLEEMKIAKKYILKLGKAKPPNSFDSLDALRKYLTLHKISDLVRNNVKAEFSGRLLVDLPKGKLKSDIDKALEKQRRFPLETALALLGRFRTSKFHHFKRGKKGVAYVSHIKRRRRLPGETFSSSIEALLGFIESNPLVEKGSLAEKHLGIAADNSENSENSNAILTLARDLRWLVKEGYVTEYADGRLETRSPLATREKMVAKSKKEYSEAEKKPPWDDPDSSSETLDSVENSIPEA